MWYVITSSLKLIELESWNFVWCLTLHKGQYCQEFNQTFWVVVVSLFTKPCLTFFLNFLSSKTKIRMYITVIFWMMLSKWIYFFHYFNKNKTVKKKWKRLSGMISENSWAVYKPNRLVIKLTSKIVYKIHLYST